MRSSRKREREREVEFLNFSKFNPLLASRIELFFAFFEFEFLRVALSLSFFFAFFMLSGNGQSRIFTPPPRL